MVYLQYTKWASIHLFKLMDPEDAPGVSAMGAHLLAEARGGPCILDGQVLGGYPLISVVGSDRLLGGGYQIFFFHTRFFCLFTAFAYHLWMLLN